MAQRGEQPLPKRSSRANTGGPDPLVYPQQDRKSGPLPRQNAYPENGKSGPLPRQNTYPEDEAVGIRRQPTSASRLDYAQTLSSQRTTGSQPSATFIPLRGQQGRARNLRRAYSATQPYEQIKERRSVHWLLPLGAGVLATIVLWMFGVSALAWGNQRYNDLRYGFPRTYQTDAYVGHHESPGHPSHFITVNLNRQAIVVEFMGGDPSKSVSYVAPVYIDGDGGNLAPITVEFRDVNGDKKPDMIIHIHLPNQDQPVVFINNGSRFRPSNGSDKIHL